MAGFDGLSPYMKVAAGQLIESPEVMRLTRDLVAMRREGRQNMFASIISGGKYGGVGRVTEANLMGPDTGRIAALEAERAKILSDAMKQRLEGAKGLANLAREGNKLAAAYIAGEATVASAVSAATAVKYKADEDRLSQLEKLQADAIQGTSQQSNIVGVLRTAANGVPGNYSRVQQAYTDLYTIPAGSFSDDGTKNLLRTYLGDKSALLAEEKAALRVMLHEKGMGVKELEAIGLPLGGPEQLVFDSQFENGQAAMQALTSRAELVDEIDAKLRRTSVGATSVGGRFRKEGSDLTSTQQTGAHLRALMGLPPEEWEILREAASNPLMPQAKERMDRIDDALGQLKSVAGGTLKKEATLYLRQYPAVPELVKTAVSSAFDAKLSAAGDDAEKKAKITEQRDNMLASVDKLGETGRGGRRIERALIGEQKALQRGVRNAAEVNTETGDVARTRARGLVVSEEARKQQKAAITAGALAGRADLAEPADEKEARGAADDAKSMIGDLGVGQGNRPVYERPSKAPKATAPKAPEEGDGQDSDEEDAEPEADATAAWQGIIKGKNPFASGAAKRDLVASRLAAMRDKPLA